MEDNFSYHVTATYDIYLCMHLSKPLVWMDDSHNACGMCKMYELNTNAQDLYMLQATYTAQSVFNFQPAFSIITDNMILL